MAAPCHTCAILTPSPGASAPQPQDDYAFSCQFDGTSSPSCPDASPSTPSSRFCSCTPERKFDRTPTLGIQSLTSLQRLIAPTRTFKSLAKATPWAVAVSNTAVANSHLPQTTLPLHRLSYTQLMSQQAVALTPRAPDPTPSTTLTNPAVLPVPTFKTSTLPSDTTSPRAAPTMPSR